MSFNAKFTGSECVSCEEPIFKGQEVEYDWDRNLMHVICPVTLTVQGTPRPVCPRCFMELPVTRECDTCDG